MVDEQNPEINQDIENVPEVQQEAPSAPAPQAPPSNPQLELPFRQNVKCQYQSCTRWSADPNKYMFTDPDTGAFYCKGHGKTCESCDTFLPQNKMFKRAPTEEWYCKECYEYNFVSCPHCKSIVWKADLLPPTEDNRWSMKKGGCNECAAKCSSCDRIVDKDNAWSENGDLYCEDCHSEHYTTCEECGGTVERDYAQYVENHGEYCGSCYKENFSQCQECEEEFENSYGKKTDDGDFYCDECIKKIGPPDYIPYTKNLSNITYTRKDRQIAQVLKLVPISVKDFKTKHQSLATSLSDLISFSKGKMITKEMVAAFRQSLSPEEFPVKYTVWESETQRSVATLGKPDKDQLTINVIASPELLGRLKQNPALYDLFDSINKVSEQSGHPYMKDQVGWIRVELDPNGEYILVDEVQSDHSNATFQLKGSQDYENVQILKGRLKERYNVERQDINRLLIDPTKQDDEDVKALRAILKRKFGRNDAELDATLAAIIKIPALEAAVDSKFLTQYPDQQPYFIVGHKDVQDDPAVKELREAYKLIGKLTDEELDEGLKAGEMPARTLTVPDTSDEINKIRDSLKSKYGLDDAGLNKLLSEYSTMLNDFPNIATQAVSRFARENGFKKLFWHTYETGMALKENAPPRSLYEKTPKENFFAPSTEKPFGLPGQFFEREAKKTEQLYKVARRMYLKYITS